MPRDRDDAIVVFFTVGSREAENVSIEWTIGREGRAWTRDEALGRFQLTPERIEMMGGKLLADDEERLILLGLLLENLGADAAVRFGDPAIWRDAVAQLL
jgi:hypothetical protein